MRFALAILFALVPAAAFAQGAPTTISFAARLTDANGTAIAGTHDFAFALYDAASGGTQLWTETQASVSVPVDGVLYLDLGSTTPLTSALLNGNARYLEMSVDGVVSDARVTIESVPYALSASLANHAADADALGGQPIGYFQRAIGSPCSSGNYVQGIGGDGSLMCAPDQSAMYLAGSGLTLAGSTFSVDANAVQARVNGMCATGAVSAIGSDGSVTCAAIPNYLAGTGITIATNTIAADFTTVQHAIGACAAGSVVNSVSAAGVPTCYSAGSGLTFDSGTQAFDVDKATIQAKITPAFGVATGSSTTNSNVYTDLGAGAGPLATATIPASGMALVTVTARISSLNSGNLACMSFAGAGATAVDSQALCYDGGDTVQFSATYLASGLTPGSQTITAKYRTTGGHNATFANRAITVVPVP
ncbi:MAG TPA: hypothetical protein VGF94_09235 [Kofleriaceae bacterium]|jgi:hypothetical protein